MLKLFTIFNSDDLKRARERNVEKEYDKILKELNSKEFINTPFFDEIKQKRVEQVERIKALSLLELESYSNPSVLLKDPYTKNHCKEYVDALIASGNTLLEMREKMAKKSIENGNDLAWDRYLEDSKSPNKLELAQIYVTTLGWWNCVNKSIDYLDGYELHESGFLSLFQNITKECEEP
jgi:hypothetical protein